MAANRCQQLTFSTDFGTPRFKEQRLRPIAHHGMAGPNGTHFKVK
jgi:hypothetical protein